MNSLPFVPRIHDLPSAIPFTGPEALERELGITFRVRVGANESAFGISPRAREAMRDAVDQVSWYGDPENHDLRKALADLHDVSVERVAVGAGIDDLLGQAVRVFIEPGDRVVTSLGGYPTFNYHVNGFGGKLHSVPYVEDRNDLEALARSAADGRAKIVYLSNPDSPAGTWHGADSLLEFVEDVPSDCVIILDEAYVEFAPPKAVFPIGGEEDRIIRMRTFSKAHGMAGARVGYALTSPPIVGAFEKVRHHFGVNRTAQIGALASLRDPEFVVSVIQAVAAGREEYHRLGEEVGLSTLPSATNFVSFDAGSAERAILLMDSLLRKGAFVRKPGVPPLDRCFRVTVGTEEERATFSDILHEVMDEIR